MTDFQDKKNLNTESGNHQSEKEENGKLKEYREKLENCQKARDEYLAGWQRERADFLNYKKEEVERTEALINTAQEELLLEFLAIFDDFQKAKKEIVKSAKDKKWLEGFLRIEQKFDRFLKKEGLERMESQGKLFNPQIHEAIEEVEKNDQKPGEIAEVLQEGYLFKGKLLRPAKVKVVKNNSDPHNNAAT